MMQDLCVVIFGLWIRFHYVSVLQGEKIFSEDEHTKLCNAFKVDSNNLQSILDTSVFILEQAAYHTAKPANLAQQLKNIQLVDDKANRPVYLRLFYRR